MHTISSYRGNRPTNKQTHKHTHRQDRLQCTASGVLSAQCKYCVIVLAEAFRAARMFQISDEMSKPKRGPRRQLKMPQRAPYSRFWVPHDPHPNSTTPLCPVLDVCWKRVNDELCAARCVGRDSVLRTMLVRRGRCSSTTTLVRGGMVVSCVLLAVNVYHWSTTCPGSDSGWYGSRQRR